MNNLYSTIIIFSNIRKEKFPTSYALKILGILLCTPIFCFQLAVNLVQAAEISFVTTAGYDDNPALTNHAKSSAFTFHDLDIAKKIILSNKYTMRVHLEGAYTNYIRVDDNFLVQAGGELTGPLISGRYIPSLLGEITFYRDSYVREDDRNEYMFGFGFSCIYSRNHTFGIKTIYRRLDYRNDARPYGSRTPVPQTNSSMGMQQVATTANTALHKVGRNRQATAKIRGSLKSSSLGIRQFSMHPPGMMNPLPFIFATMANNSMRMRREMQTLSTTFSARDDNLFNIHFFDNVFLRPNLNGTVYGGFAWLDSSLDLESYRQWYVGGEMRWDFRAQWQLSLNAGLALLDYYHGPDPFDRLDSTYSTGLRLSRFIKHVELFCQFDWFKKNSDLHIEFYHQAVSQCGLSLSF